MQPEVVGSFTEQDSDGQDPSELRGAGFAEAELPPLKPLLPPELTSASAASASFFFFAITASCFCCSRTSASMATLACCACCRASVRSRSRLLSRWAIRSRSPARCRNASGVAVLSSIETALSRPTRYDWAATSPTWAVSPTSRPSTLVSSPVSAVWRRLELSSLALASMCPLAVSSSASCSFLLPPSPGSAYAGAAAPPSTSATTASRANRARRPSRGLSLVLGTKASFRRPPAPDEHCTAARAGRRPAGGDRRSRYRTAGR